MNEWQPIETAPVGQRITLPQPRALPQLLLTQRKTSL